MKILKQSILILILFLVTVGTAIAAPPYKIERTIIPEADDTYDLGSITKKWANIFVNIIGSTADRVVKGWFTDLEVTNPIVADITGNSETVTTNANLTGPITSVGNATSITEDAVKDIHIDWGTGSQQVSAIDVPILDTGGYYIGTEVETALEEIADGTTLDTRYVRGPPSAINNAITRYDGTTGKLVKDSLSTLSNTGTINIPLGETYQINSTPLTYTDITNSVGSSSILGDNKLIRGDGGGRGVQGSDIDIDDSNNMSGMGTGHDVFTDFIADEHVAHSTVNLIAGEGLSGGGDISVSRNFALDLNELSTITNIAAGDKIPFTDIDDSNANKNITFGNFESFIDHLNIQNIGVNTHAQIDSHIASNLNPHNVTLEQARIAGDTFAGDVSMGDNTLSDIEKLILDTTPASPGSAEGTIYWNGTDYTLDIVTGLGPVLQANQETVVVVYNNTPSQIDNGKVVHAVPGAFNSFPYIEKAISDTHEGITNSIWLTTMDIPAGQIGFVTQFGKVRGLDTSGLDLGTVWVSPTTAGELTNTKPDFPNYAVQVGGVLVKDALDGVIGINTLGIAEDTIVNFWNGVFRESFDFRITSDGTTITGTLTPSNGHPDMTMMFSDGFTLLDTDPGATITLTAGSATIPQTNYVYIPKSTKVLTVSTSSWPFLEEHIKVAEVVLRTPTIVRDRGALRNQNWNDHIEDTHTFQGHLPHIGERLRIEDAKWDSGVEGSVDIGAGGEVWIKNTAGVVYQMHRQNFPLLDTTQYDIDAVSQGSKTFTISGDGDLSSTFPDDRKIIVNDSTGNDGNYTIVSTNYSAPDFVITVEESIPSAVADGSIGDNIRVVNDFTTAYNTVYDLSDITTDASGNALNNTSFSVVVWGVANKSGELSHLMANMPTDTYNKNFPEQSVDDAFNRSVYTIPKQFQGVGFLIARFTFVNTSGVWSLYDTQDLRGITPNIIAGGGGGGGGITTFLGLTDTPSTYTGNALNIPRINAGETALEFLDITTDWLSQYLPIDGSRAMTGDLDMGSNKIINLASPTSNNDAANKEYVDNAIDGVKRKEPADVATTGNITLSGEQTIDGVLTSSSRVLVWQQTDATENGIYTSNSGAWTRTGDADTGNEIVAATLAILQGSTHINKEFNNNNDSITLGVTNITFVQKASTIDHNSTTGKQGGTTGQYYHFTSAEHSNLTSFASEASYMLLDGTRPLTGNWDAGSWKITAETLESDIATGTAPFTVASTTKVTNLNSDLLDDQTGSYYLDSINFTGTDWTDLTDGGATTLHKHDHGLLDGLTDDDHTQYALLAGRSGGQTLIGDTVASGNLTLQSTANATKGKILFGTSAYDEVNNRLGIGTNSPQVRLDIDNGSGTPPSITTPGSLVIREDDAVFGGISLQTFGAGVTYKGYRTQGTRSTPTAVVGGAELAGLQGYGWNSADNDYSFAGDIRIVADETYSTAGYGGGRFVVRLQENANGSLITPMTIKNNGNVGIGTTAPGANLDIEGGTGTGIIEINGANGGCLKIRDTDDAGFTYCTVLNGTMTCSTSPC